MIVVSTLNSVTTIAVVTVVTIITMRTTVVGWNAARDGTTISTQAAMETRVMIGAMVSTIAAAVTTVVSMSTVGSIPTNGCQCEGVRGHKSQGESEAAAPHDVEGRNFCFLLQFS